MINLGFSPNEMNLGEQLYQKDGMFIPKSAKELMGEQNYFQFGDIIKYYINTMHGDNDCVKTSCEWLYNNPVQDSVPLEELGYVCKHYQKMYKYWQRGIAPLTMYDFTAYGKSNLKAYCNLRNLTGPYEIYNQGTYEVKEYGKKKTVITTDKCPEVKNESDLNSKVVKFEKDLTQENVYNLTIDNSSVGLINRYAIIVSLKPPIDHCGCCCVVTSGGTTIYIYALMWNQNDKKRDEKIQNSGGQITNQALVISWGFNSQKLEKDLKEATEHFYQKFDGRFRFIIRPMNPFQEGIEWLAEEQLTEEQQENIW